MRTSTKGLKLLTLVVLWAVLVGNSRVWACEHFDRYGISACVDLFMNAYVRLPQVDRTYFFVPTEKFITKHADNVLELLQRDQLRITLDGSPQFLKDAAGFPIRWHLELLPWDTTHDSPARAKVSTTIPWRATSIEPQHPSG